MENRSKMIIVEGPQGTGKTTLANYLRDNMSGSNLYRLSGQKDKTDKGYIYSYHMYKALLEYLTQMEYIPMDMIFDRIFTSEEVYSRLGYKEYSFTKAYQEFVEKLNRLEYDIYYFSLYLNDLELFRERLIRNHHNYQSFSVENSSNQQEMYLNICNELDEYDNINVIKLPMDDFEESYKRVRKVLSIK